MSSLDFDGTPWEAKDKPWFLYLACNLPHLLLHAPKELIDKYQQVCEQGWDVIREKRFARTRQLGLIDSRWKMPTRSVVGPNRVSDVNGWAGKQNPAWDTIPAGRRKDLAWRMAIFAAMVERMDQNIGRVLGDLEATGELSNTLILFCADTGACAEWDPWGFDISSGPDNVLHSGAKLDEMGQPGTYHSCGSGWANTCNTPWRLYKHYTHEGGISTPTIARWPAGLKARAGGVNHQPWHFIDVPPTLAAVAGAKAPAETAGVNLAPMLQGKKVNRGPLFWEHEGSRAVRDGKWKITALYPKGEWALYDIEADRTEQVNLAAQHPERVKRMAAQWEVWARQNHVIPWIWSPQFSETSLGKAPGCCSLPRIQRQIQSGMRFVFKEAICCQGDSSVRHSAPVCAVSRGLRVRTSSCISRMITVGISQAAMDNRRFRPQTSTLWRSRACVSPAPLRVRPLAVPPGRSSTRASTRREMD